MSKFEQLKEYIAKFKPKNTRTTRSVLAKVYKINQQSKIARQCIYCLLQIDKDQSTNLYSLIIYRVVQKLSFLMQAQIQTDFQEQYKRLTNKIYLLNQKVVLQFKNQSQANIINDKIKKILKKKAQLFGCCYGRPPRQRVVKNLNSFVWLQKGSNECDWFEDTSNISFNKSFQTDKINLNPQNKRSLLQESILKEEQYSDQAKQQIIKELIRKLIKEKQMNNERIRPQVVKQKFQQPIVKQKQTEAMKPKDIPRQYQIIHQQRQQDQSMAPRSQQNGVLTKKQQNMMRFKMNYYQFTKLMKHQEKEQKRPQTEIEKPNKDSLIKIQDYQKLQKSKGKNQIKGSIYASSYSQVVSVDVQGLCSGGKEKFMRNLHQKIDDRELQLKKSDKK